MSAGGALVTYECDDHVATITYHRPEVRNAINGELRDDLNAAWERFRADDDAWVAIVTGAGRSRSASAPTCATARGSAGTFARVVLGDPDDQLVRERAGDLEADDRGGQRLLPRLRPHRGARVRLRDRGRRRRVRLPRGAARRADDRRRDAAARARRHAARARDPAHRRPHRRGQRAARSASRCASCRAPTCSTRRRHLARRLCQGAPLAVRAVNEMAHRGQDLPWADAVRFGETMRRVAAQTDDAREGMAAAAERRAPHWQGR